jgi:hypothetical protein
MLYALAVILLIAWLLGIVGTYTIARSSMCCWSLPSCCSSLDCSAAVDHWHDTCCFVRPDGAGLVENPRDESMRRDLRGSRERRLRAGPFRGDGRPAGSLAGVRRSPMTFWISVVIGVIVGANLGRCCWRSADHERERERREVIPSESCEEVLATREMSEGSGDRVRCFSKRFFLRILSRVHHAVIRAVSYPLLSVRCAVHRRTCGSQPVERLFVSSPLASSVLEGGCR